jgi:hypothetical protein
LNLGKNQRGICCNTLQILEARGLTLEDIEGNNVLKLPPCLKHRLADDLSGPLPHV